MKTVIEMAREAGLFVFNDSIHPRDNDEPLNTYLERFAALVREDAIDKLNRQMNLACEEARLLGGGVTYTPVGEVKDGSFGGFVWNEGITSDEAPDGAVLYVRSEK